jgi:hypothetical protein
MPWADRLITHLNDAHVRHFACLIDWDLGNAFDPVLDGVCDMGNDLDGLAKVFSFSLTLWIMIGKVMQLWIEKTRTSFSMTSR